MLYPTSTPTPFTPRKNCGVSIAIDASSEYIMFEAAIFDKTFAKGIPSLASQHPFFDQALAKIKVRLGIHIQSHADDSASYKAHLPYHTCYVPLDCVRQISGKMETPLLPFPELDKSPACLAMQKHHAQFCATLKPGDKVLLLRRYGNCVLLRHRLQGRLMSLLATQRFKVCIVSTARQLQEVNACIQRLKCACMLSAGVRSWILPRPLARADLGYPRQQLVHVLPAPMVVDAVAIRFQQLEDIWGNKPNLYSLSKHGVAQWLPPTYDPALESPAQWQRRMGAPHYLLKPARGRRGQGIRVVTAANFLKEFSAESNCIAQTLVEPVLANREGKIILDHSAGSNAYKFDFRIYIVVVTDLQTGGCELFFAPGVGKMKLCSEPYDLNPADMKTMRFRVLTNCFVNKSNAKAEQLRGTMTLDQFFDCNATQAADIRKGIAQMLTDIFTAGVRSHQFQSSMYPKRTKPTHGTFRSACLLFGADVMLERRTGKPVCLEWNKWPSVRGDDPVSARTYPRMFESFLGLVQATGTRDRSSKQPPLGTSVGCFTLISRSLPTTFESSS